MTEKEAYTTKAFGAMWSEMKKLGFTPISTTSGNDLAPSLGITIGEREIQIFTPNSLEQNLDNDDVNTYTIWHGDSDSWTGDPYGQTLYETIELIKGLKDDHRYDSLRALFGTIDIQYNRVKTDCGKSIGAQVLVKGKSYDDTLLDWVDYIGRESDPLGFHINDTCQEGVGMYIEFAEK